MIEKKTMFYVSGGFSDPEEETAIVDENGKILYAGEEELYKVDDDEQKNYFSTMEAAKSFVNERRSQAIESLPIVEGYLKYLRNDIGSNGDEWKAVESKYWNVFQGLSSEDRTDWLGEYKCARAAVYALKSGYIAINGTVIQLSSVLSVQFGINTALVAYDGNTISTNDRNNIKVLKFIFT